MQTKQDTATDRAQNTIKHKATAAERAHDPMKNKIQPPTERRMQ
jgi:hypothetical protein